MSLWGNVDNAANSALFATMQVNKTANTDNQTELYQNTTANVYFTGVTVGQFGVDANESQAVEPGAAKPPHAGWVLRTVGTGGRAGRVQYETLVAMGSMSGDGEDTVFPDYRITILSQPSSNTIGSGNAVNLVVSAVSVPSGAALTYNWQSDGGTGGPWADVQDDGSVFAGNTATTLEILDNATLNANNFRVQVSVTGGVTVNSSNALIIVL